MTKLNMSKLLVVLSGGQDSTTCLFLAADVYGARNISTISFDYGQRHKAELQCAIEAAAELGCPHEIFDLSLLTQLTPNALVQHNIPITVEPGELPSTFVDGRNLLFLTIAAIRAKQQGIGTIVTGVCQTDFSGYPDCRDVFVKSCNATISLALDSDISILTPLMWLTKAQTWQVADELGRLNYIREHTLTCYEGIVGDGCRECPACKLRKKGLDEYLDTVGIFGMPREEM